MIICIPWYLNALWYPQPHTNLYSLYSVALGPEPVVMSPEIGSEDLGPEAVAVSPLNGALGPEPKVLNGETEPGDLVVPKKHTSPEEESLSSELSEDRKSSANGVSKVELHSVCCTFNVYS